MTRANHGWPDARACIATTAPIFDAKGLAGSWLVDLGEGSGLENGGLHRHFSSEGELTVAAFDYNKATIAFHRLRARVDLVAASIEKPPLPGGCLILHTATEAVDTHPERGYVSRRGRRDEPELRPEVEPKHLFCRPFLYTRNPPAKDK